MTDSWYRVCVDTSASHGTVHYARERDVDVTEHGHLKLKDADGRFRLVSAGHKWTVTECDTPPVSVTRDSDGPETRTADTLLTGESP